MPNAAMVVYTVPEALRCVWRYPTGTGQPNQPTPKKRTSRDTKEKNIHDHEFVIKKSRHEFA